MSKIEELKKQNPNLKIDIIDIISLFTNKSKYIELLVNLQKKENRYRSERQYLIQELRENYYICQAKVESKTTIELSYILYVLRDFIGHKDRADAFYDFMSYNERKLIENNDLTKYSSFDEILNATSVAELKSDLKEFEKETHKIYENNEWILLKPLSWESAKKYGYGTRWCTSSRDDYNQFYRYSNLGVLIYCINKLNGKKVAVFNDLNEKDDISFWNAEDKRIDSIFSGLPIEILEVIKNQLLIETKSNSSYFSEKENKRYLENFKAREVTEAVQPIFNMNDLEETFGIIGRNNLDEVIPSTLSHTADNQLRIVYPD